MPPAFRTARSSAIVISSGTSNDSISTFSLRLSRIEYSTRRLASWSKRASCIERYDSIPRLRCNRTLAPVLYWRHAFKLRRVSAVKIIFERPAIFLFDQAPVWSFDQQLLHSLFVLF